MKNITLLAAITLALFTQIGEAATQSSNSNVNRPSTVDEKLSDTAITARVKEEFIAEKLFGDNEISSLTISVKTVHGIVYLSGTADNKDQLNTAISLAKQVPGVKKVESKVKVKYNN